MFLDAARLVVETFLVGEHDVAVRLNRGALLFVFLEARRRTLELRALRNRRSAVPETIERGVLLLHFEEPFEFFQAHGYPNPRPGLNPPAPVVGGECFVVGGDFFVLGVVNVVGVSATDVGVFWLGPGLLNVNLRPNSSM